MRLLKLLGYAIFFYLCLLSLPASADQTPLTVGIHYWPKVYDGMAQSYNVKVSGNVHGAYIVLSLHPDNSILNVNHTDGLECTQFPGDGLTVMCYAERIQGDEVLGVHGTILGPGDNGMYGILRVGTMEEGSPGRGWILNADYGPRGGTIPSALAPRDEPERSTLFLPLINGG